MQVELSAAIAVGSLIFAAGGGWFTLSTTAKSASSQGKRIGELEGRVRYMEGILRVRHTQLGGVPILTEEKGEDE